MDKDMSIILVSTATRCARELGQLVPMLKQFESSERGEEIKHSIASIIYDIMENVVGAAAPEGSEVHRDMEARMTKYGRAF